ncbi:mitogen-activated protein kinase kinase kinase 14 [Pholidichthys leucotaenia]
MAVMQRIFNSTYPFCDPPQAKLKGLLPPYPVATEQETEDEKEEDGGEDGKRGFGSDWAMNSLISKLLMQGTAEQVGEKPLKTSTIVAQAECETQDSQEFTPSGCERSFVPPGFTSSISSEPNNVACPTTASIQEPSGPTPHPAPRKKTQRRQKRRGKKKEKQRQRQRHRTPSGVPEQESGGSLVLILELSSSGRSSDLSTSCSSSCRSSVDSSEEIRGLPLYSPQICRSGSSCSPLNWSHQLSKPLSSLHSFSDDDSSDSLSSVGDCSLAVTGLRGFVSQGDPCFAGPFFKDVEWEVREDEEEQADSVVNEGLIFHNDNIQLVDSEYKEGREYVTQFIREGSYGEVHRAMDLGTGFKFAIKKVELVFSNVDTPPRAVLSLITSSTNCAAAVMEIGSKPLKWSRTSVILFCPTADNVVLSENGRDAFLCDFGHAERLDGQGLSLSMSRDLKGSESHMAPEVVKGEPRGAKADVWSSCCMFLHMLNGCPPWTRYYTCLLYLKIANKPPPLREIPPNCCPLTADVLKAGLWKDPVKRSSASELREKASRALREVGGLRSPVKGPYMEPLYLVPKAPDSPQLSDSWGESEEEAIPEWGKTDRLDSEEEVDGNFNGSKPHLGHQIRMSETSHRRENKVTSESELELRKLEMDFYLSSLSQLHSAEMQEQLLSCLSSDPYPSWEPWDKKDSGRWSLSPGDDFSSGVFSTSSQPDVQGFSLDLLGQTQKPPPCFSEGVGVFVRSFRQKIICIREWRHVTVGHIAIEISDQISERIFTLETEQGRLTDHDEEVQESGLELCCVPAPDFSYSWRWRIRDGVLETR